MTALTFDTLAFVKKLEARGFQTEQAEGVTDALKDVLAMAEVATTRDLKDAETTLKQDIKELENVTKRDFKELDSKIEALRLELKAEIAPLKWMAGASTAGIIALIIKTFF